MEIYFEPLAALLATYQTAVLVVGWIIFAVILISIVRTGLEEDISWTKLSIKIFAGVVIITLMNSVSVYQPRLHIHNKVESTEAPEAGDVKDHTPPKTTDKERNKHLDHVLDGGKDL